MVELATPYVANGKFVSDTSETMGGKFCIKNAYGTVVAVTWEEPVRDMIVAAVNLVASSHAGNTIAALTKAESFISGFEDDPLQDGIADILAGLRAAVQHEQARPDMLAYIKRMANFTTPDDEFEDRKGEDGTVYDDGITYESADELLADFSDERLGDEFATFCEMIQEARRLRDAAGGRAGAVALAERDRIAKALDDGADGTPCVEDEAAARAPMDNMIETLDWLAVQFRDRANEDPAEHTEQDAGQVESARKAALNLLAVLKLAVSDWPQFHVELAPRQPGCQPEDVEVNGGDLVEWFGNWRRAFVLPAIAKAEGRANG